VPTTTPTAPSGGGQGEVMTPEPELHAPGGGYPPARAVLVGVDGGECALAAVGWAAEEAQRRDAPLRIVHAAPYLARRLEPGSIPPELPRARRITGQAYTVARHSAGGVRAETEVVPGEPAAVLLREGQDAQLLVLGISTTGAMDELVRAAVAQRVAARSDTPVVVVPRSRGGAPAGRPVAAILGLGDPDDDEPVVAWAADAARRSGAPLTVLQPRARGAGGVPAVEWQERLPDLQVTAQDVPGASPDDLLKAVCPAPVMVLSVGHGTFMHRLLDGPHRYLLRHCTSPLALVPPVHRPERDPREEIIAVG
jgi:nucleotide-binding universal stress UspA family protein